MALESSGTMSIGGSTSGRSINLELGRPATQSSNLDETDLRSLADVPGSGNQIGIDDFYGASAAVESTGGAKFELGGNTIHLFTGPGTFTISESTNCFVLLIGGGGGGGGDRGSGGGGAGGMVYYGPGPTPSQAASITLNGPYPVSIGSGGDGAPGTNPNGSQGGDSSFPGVPMVAKGGGFGNSTANSMQPGGSGGGGRHNENYSSASSATQPPLGGFGNAGGPQSAGTNMGSGGGGAAFAGTSGGGSFPPHGKGGDGKPISWLPGPGVYPLLPGPYQSTLGTGWRDALGSSGFFAGGGGGGSNEPPPGGAPGGNGGGGQGGQNSAGVDAVDYTGSGGGGAGVNGDGGDGGNGICIIAFPT